MPTLEELRRMLQEGVEAEKPRDIREGRVGWGEDEAPTDHLNDFKDTDEHGGGRGIDPAKMRKARDVAAKRPEKGSPPRYTASVEGDDAILHFGKFRDKSVSFVAGDEPSYLAWLLREFSPLKDIRTRDLMDIVRYQIKRIRDPKARAPHLRDKGAPSKVDASKLAKGKWSGVGSHDPEAAEAKRAEARRARFEAATPEERLKMLFEKKGTPKPWFDCPACRGTGARHGIAGAFPCKECSGKGRIE